MRIVVSGKLVTGMEDILHGCIWRFYVSYIYLYHDLGLDHHGSLHGDFGGGWEELGEMEIGT